MAATTEHDRARLAVTWRVAAAGPVLGAVAAAAVGLAGGSGAGGLAVLLAVMSLATILAGLLTAVHLLVDEFRRQPVALRRLWTAVALFVAGLVLLTLSFGAVA